jgi:hypothetical protein
MNTNTKCQQGTYTGIAQGGIANNELPISSSSSYVSSAEIHDPDTSISSQIIAAPEDTTQQLLFTGSPQKKLKKEFQTDDHERLNANNTDLVDLRSNDITPITATDN